MSRSALAGARGLAAAGWTVGVGSPSRGLAPASRTVARWHHVPAPERGVDAFVAGLSAAIEDGGYDVVLPSDDGQVLALSQRRLEIPAVTPYTSHPHVVAAFDKRRLTEAAAEAGLAVPRTWSSDGPALEQAAGPFFVKPAVHPNLTRDDAPSHHPSARAATAEDARAHARRIEAAGGTAVVQELIEGVLTAYSVVVDPNRGVVAEAQQRAHAVWPRDGGISVRAESVAVDRDLAERARRLLARFEWRGLAELQFVEPAHGPPRLIDLNGRLYGSLALAIAAGANLPAAWAAVATGRDVVERSTARPGVRYHWLEGDVRLALGADGSGRGELVRALRWMPGAAHSVWDLRDPGPALRYAGLFARRGLMRAARRLS